MSINGLFVQGKMLGGRQREKRNNKGYYNELGLSIEKSDGFGGTLQDQFIIRVPDGLVSSGVLNQANSLIGKTVRVPVYGRPWSMEGREGITFFMQNDSGITEVK